jgi:hypothetical protein
MLSVRQRHLIVNSTQCNENILTLCYGIRDEDFYYISGSHSCFHRNYIRMDSLSMHTIGYIHNVLAITMQD